MRDIRGSITHDETHAHYAGEMDHGVLNVPGRLNNINSQLDRFKAGQASEKKASAKAHGEKFSAAQKQAKELLAKHGEALVAKNKEKFGEKQAREVLARVAKQEPEKFIRMITTELSRGSIS